MGAGRRRLERAQGGRRLHGGIRGSANVRWPLGHLSLLPATDPPPASTLPPARPVPTVNTSLACLSLLSNDCIAQYTLPGCRQLVLNARKASADAEARGEAPPGGTSAVGGSPWDPQGTPADPTAAPQGPAGGGGGGGGGSESGTPWWLPVVVGVLGGEVDSEALEGAGATHRPGR